VYAPDGKPREGETLMKIEMLANRTGYLEDIEEVRHQWIEDILNYLGIETEIFHDEEAERLVLVEYLAFHKIDLIDYPSIDAWQVFHEGSLVGEWAGPDFELEEEDGEKYYRITIETWSILEEDIEL
jgi:hypothetical protein